MATAANYDPIDNLRAQIAQASMLPEPEPYVPSAEPLELLRTRLTGEEPPESAKDDRTTSEPTAPGGLDAIVGREVLALVGSSPLPAEARVEAVRRLAIAVQNPTPENVRSILSVLVTGRTDA